MQTLVQAPLELVEEVAALQFPLTAAKHLQELMDRNTNGQLSPVEKKDLDALAELSKRIALIRAKALLLLGREPT